MLASGNWFQKRWQSYWNQGEERQLKWWPHDVQIKNLPKKKKKKSQDLGNTCGSGRLEKKLKKRHIIKYDVNHYRENWKILTEDEQTYLQCRKFNLGVERRLAWRETRQSKSRKQREEWPTVEMTGTWIMAVVAACGRQKNLGGTKEILRKNIYRLDTEEMSWP